MKRIAILLALLVLASATLLLWRAEPRDVDDVLTGFMGHERIAGATLAIARDGKVLDERAYGVADPLTGRAMVPQDRLRVASLSKPVTAAAVMTLIEAGDVSLEAKVRDLLPSLDFSGDLRYADQTIRHLLRHRGGWDRVQTFEPMLEPESWAALGLEDPRSCAPIAEAMLRRPLEFAPGEEYAYSNLGYCLLGLVIERVTGQPYEVVVRSRLLDPLGIEGVALERAAATAPPLALAENGWREVREPDRLLDVLGPAGGWVAPAGGLARLLSADIMNATLAHPEEQERGEQFYGFGWRVWPTKDGPIYTHFGAIPGAFSIVIRLPDGLTVVVLMNGRPGDDWAAFGRLLSALPAALEAETEDF